MNSSIIPAPPTEAEIAREIDAAMAHLCFLWGTLDRGQALKLEQSEVRRNVLSRVKAMTEVNEIFVDIRRVFGIPEDVMIRDFPAWLADALRRQREIWEMEAGRKRIEGDGEIKDTTLFIVSDS